MTGILFLCGTASLAQTAIFAAGTAVAAARPVPVELTQRCSYAAGGGEFIVGPELQQ